MTICFDKMLKKYHAAPVLGAILADANLFDIRSQSEIPAFRPFDDFFLPFEVIALETISGCFVFVEDPSMGKGIEHRRICLYAIGDDLYTILFKDYTLKGITCSVNVYNGVSIEKVPDDVADYIIRFVKNALRAIHEINHSESFIVEERPVQTGNIKRKGYLLSYQRPKFTLLTPTLRRQILGKQTKSTVLAAGGTRIPHAKRRHYRTLRSPRFKKKRGQTIIIPACWVGASEATIGGKIYKVRLDL